MKIEDLIGKQFKVSTELDIIVGDPHDVLYTIESIVAHVNELDWVAITWEEDSIPDKTHYPVTLVLEFFKKGDWILQEN